MEFINELKQGVIVELLKSSDIDLLKVQLADDILTIKFPHSTFLSRTLKLGHKCFLLEEVIQGKKTYSLELIEVNTELIGVNIKTPKKLILSNWKDLFFLDDYTGIDCNVFFDGIKIDFVFDNHVVMDVKNVFHQENDYAIFPEKESPISIAHLKELIKLVTGQRNFRVNP